MTTSPEGKQLWRLCAGFPKDEVLLDRIELFEARSTLRCREDFVYVRRLDAVRDQRPWKRDDRSHTQGALPGKLFGIKEVGPACRRGLQFVFVVCDALL